MRVIGLIGLVLALAIVGLLVKKQLGHVATPVAPTGMTSPSGASAGDVRAQSRQIQDQVRQSLDQAMQQRQPVPDDN
jgi:hypothetical protein